MNASSSRVNQPKLIRRLGEADRTWRRAGAAELFLRSIKFLCVIIALLVALDLVAQLGSIPRLLISGCVVLGCLAFVGYLFNKIFPSKPSLLPVARLLEDRDRTLGSKLINVLQLDEKANDESLPPLTRSLARQAIDEAAESVERHNFSKIAQSREIPRLFRHALVPIALALIPAIYFAPISWREVLRFADPFGDHPPFSFTTLEIVVPSNDDTEVIFNQPVAIEAEFHGHRPKELFLTVTDADNPKDSVTIPMFPRGDDGFFQEIDQVGKNLTVRAHTKSRRSISEAREVGVILTPQLEAARVSIVAPAYTQMEDRENRVALERKSAPTLSVLAGSKLEFALDSNRPLSEGSAALQSASPETREFKMVVGDVEEAPNTVTGSMEAIESGRLRFDMRDVTGLQADRELAVNLIVTHDLAPEISITEPIADGYIVETYSTKVGIRSSDDYGLKSIRIHTGVNDQYYKPRSIDLAGDPPLRASVEQVDIYPVSLGARPGDIISVFAEATDICPEPQMARTRTLKLEVITEEDYNDYLRMQTEIRDLEKKYSDLHNELKNLAQEQRELAEQAAAEAAKAEADPEKRDELAKQQEELNNKLLELAEKMESATRDKPLYDLENEFQDVLDEEAQKIRDSVAENQKGNEEFKKSAPSGQSMQAFGEQAKEQAERLDPAREEAEKQIAEAMEDADLMQQLLKALGAYQELYKRQEELASQTAAYKTEPGSDKGHESKLALQQMAGTERFIGEALDKIVEDLREGADNAEDAFPEAAADARGIADQIEAASLSNLADHAASTMLSGRGAASHERAEHLRKEMEKLMGECSECKGGAAGEFAARLKLMRGMMAGDTMGQMGQSRNFGLGFGKGQSGAGMGMAGVMGMGGAQMGEQQSLLGGESNLGQNTPPQAAQSGEGKADQPDSPSANDADDGRGEAERMAIIDRPSKAGTGDAISDEYNEVVEAYFQKLTTSKQANETKGEKE